MNRLSHHLHSSALDILGWCRLSAAWPREFRECMACRSSSRAMMDLEAISPDVKLCLFRIAQEALSNVVKQSGAAPAEVRLVGANGTRSITLTVADDGKGFNPDQIEIDSLGIISMRERPRLVGGELRILSSRLAGTRVEVSVPLGNGIPQEAASAV